MNNPSVLLRRLLWMTAPALLIAGIFRAITRRDGNPPQVILKLRDNNGRNLPRAQKAREVEEMERDPARYLGPRWKKLVKDFPEIRIERLITSLPPEKILNLVDRANERDPSYRPPDFLSYFTVRCPSRKVARTVAKTLRSFEMIETSYVQGGPSRPPGVHLSPGEGVNQWYLESSPANGGSPGGIDARYAWGFSGGDGDGVQFVDLEWGWVLEHEDLPKGIQLIDGGPNNSRWRGHGTAILGIVLAQDNNMDPAFPFNKACVGISPHVKTPRVVSPGEWDEATSSWKHYSVANAILAASDVLQFGDVLLLEVQTITQDFSGKDYPVEVLKAEFDAIQLATTAGIVVIEAAGNKMGNLDGITFRKPGRGEFSLNRSNIQFPDTKPIFQGDSGAIMVGYAYAPTRLRGASNYGSRIDCYACDNISTIGYGDEIGPLDVNRNKTVPEKSYCWIGGTSGSSAIIAGAALAIQGIAQAKFNGHRFSPSELREVLSDQNKGTLSGNPPTDMIGVMPDLREIITNINNGSIVPNSVRVASGGVTVPP